ncbi:MAG: hypothetical protein FWF25_04470 [Propionibacteriaceae bacterium]|nr:hypothetical protein [Propionibacteriaceae bacterium]
MSQSDAITAGAFTIVPAETELAEALTAAIKLEQFLNGGGGDADAPETGFPAVLDVRRLTLADSEGNLPPIFALAMDTEAGTVWMVRGEIVLALIPVKKADSPKKMVSVLASWVESFTAEGAAGMVGAAYSGMDDSHDDDSVHLVAELPLDGIDLHRPDTMAMDEWLDMLTETAESVLDRVEADAEVILFDASDENTSIIGGHIEVFSDDDEDAINLTRQALLAAFTSLTPQKKVRDRLSIVVEDQCMYDMYEDILSTLDDPDILLPR